MNAHICPYCAGNVCAFKQEDGFEDVAAGRGLILKDQMYLVWVGCEKCGVSSEKVRTNRVVTDMLVNTLIRDWLRLHRPDIDVDQLESELREPMVARRNTCPENV